VPLVPPVEDLSKPDDAAYFDISKLKKETPGWIRGVCVAASIINAKAPLGRLFLAMCGADVGFDEDADVSVARDIAMCVLC
jgi:hypothetical protein